MENRFSHYLDWSHQPKKGLLRYLLGSVLITGFSLYIGQMFSFVGALLIHSDSPAATIIKTTFFGFIFSFLLIPIIAAIIHRRPWWSIAMPYRRFNFKAFAVGFFSVVVLQVISNLISYWLNPQNYHYKGADWQTWIPMLFLYLIVFFVQVSTEEMVYRGYLSQFVYRFSKRAWLVLLIPSIIFSLPHYGNIQGGAGIMALAPYAIMGIMFGWLAYRSGSLWMPIGAHLANNWFVTMFVGLSGENVQKISLFQTQSDVQSLYKLSLSMLVFAVLVIALCELLMHRFGLIRKTLNH